MKLITLYELRSIVTRHLKASPAKFKLRTHKCYVRRGPHTHANVMIEPCVPSMQSDQAINIHGETDTLYHKLVKSLMGTQIEMTFAKDAMIIICAGATLDCNVATAAPKYTNYRARKRTTDA